MNLWNTSRCCGMMLLLGCLTIGVSQLSAVEPAPPVDKPLNTKSGMLLGVYCVPAVNGLKITRTIPGYAAHERLHSDDVLLRVTDGKEMFKIRTLDTFEDAKTEIGPFKQAALEVFRPAEGVIYLWVEFQPIKQQAAYKTNAIPTEAEYFEDDAPAPSSAPPRPEAETVEVEIMTESEKPGAKSFFQEADEAASPSSEPGAKSLFGN
ncbi:Hypothetical protein PBC10988_31750 [Planctomycetales bacterium 10988]|nr:Hypothetical protein PBC10988_31750 [Planctomycetales bacterium 10988]